MECIRALSISINLCNVIPACLWRESGSVPLMALAIITGKIIMILILLTVTLAGLKYFEFNFMEHVSWWWVVGSFFLTFIWFEVFERILGFDKKKLHEK